MLRPKNIEDKIASITNLAINTALDAKINELKGKILSITNLANNFALNAKINKVRGKISSITNLATTTALITVENKILNFSDLEYFTISDCNKFTENILDVKITAKKLVNESGLNEKTKILAIKKAIKKLGKIGELKAEQNKTVKLKTYDLSHDLLAKVTLSMLSKTLLNISTTLLYFKKSRRY